MRIASQSSQRPLSRRLAPLAYGLVALVGLILGLTWGALQIQVALAGFLNGESVWSKSLKQLAIDLDAYAATGDSAYLQGFERNYALLAYDRYARDATAQPNFDKTAVREALSHGNAIPEAVPGVIFMLHYLHQAPYMHDALWLWRSTDSSVAELGAIAAQLRAGYAAGGLTPRQIAAQRERIYAINRFVGPLSNQFSLQIAHGASWLGRVLFLGVLAAAIIATLLWLRLAARVLASIRGSEERYQLVFDSAADAIMLIDEADGQILEANRTAARWSGLSAEQLIGRPMLSLLVDGQIADGRLQGSAFLGADGVRRAVEIHSSMAHWGERQVRQAIIRDISERLAIERERRVAAEALASIAEGVIIANAERCVTSVNQALTRLTGYTASELLGQRFDFTRQLPDGEPLSEAMWHTLEQGGNWRGEVVSLRRDGSSYPELLSISAIRDADGRILHLVAVCTDITQAKLGQQRLEHMASHDPLTGLINRAEFERHCDLAVAEAARRRRAAAVLFVDLDAFKAVNDSYSHAAGDRLLQQVAARIGAQLGEHDLLGRIGGDEFTILCPDLGQREQVAGLASRVLRVLAEPFLVEDFEVALSASIGIAGYPLDGEDTVNLIANADAAMYVAKTEERNTYRYYSPVMHADTRRRLALATELRHALLRDEFELLYQPSVDLRSGRTVALEALVRWRHPERGLLQPAEFIPAAEQMGLIRQIDEWVMRAACQQMRRWDASGLPSLRVAVNVSARWVSHPGFIDSVRGILRELPLPPLRLLVEITEGTILRLGEETERTMYALHDLGIGVAIDDFGTGYSSLAYLKLPAVAYLKIDRSFISGLPRSANDAAIVEAILAMSRSLGLCAIAEGIESQDQHDFLLRAGCQEGQGFLYARPLGPYDIEQRLGAHARPGARLRLVPPERKS